MKKNNAKLGLGLLLLALLFEGACSVKPPKKVADGEAHNLFRKTDLVGETHSLASPKANLAPLLNGINKEKATKVRFEVSKSYLTAYSAEGKNAGEPVLQFPIEDHWDLVAEKDKEGHESQYLVKDKKANEDWSKRAYVEVDPYDKREIAPMRETMANLYALDGFKKSYVIGSEELPGLKGRELSAVMSQFNLKKGDSLEIKLSKTELLYYSKTSASQPVIVARLPIAYFDLIRKTDDEGQEQAELVRDQKVNIWSSRRYVEINPDVANVQDGDEKLYVKEDIDGKCFKVSDASVEIIKALKSNSKLNADSELCMEVSQTVLSVYEKKGDKRDLLLTFDIKEHLDVNLAADDISDILPNGKYSGTWDKRKYMRLSLSNPHIVESLVQANVVKKADFAGEYLYVATVISAHSENGMLFPGQTLTGANRLRFEIGENDLTAYKVGEHLNPTAAPSPSLRYAVDQFDVGRIRNDYGDGTHLVAELKDKPWQQRQNLRVSFSQNKIKGFFNDFFAMEKLFGSKMELSESRLLGEPEIADGYISFETEDVFTPGVPEDFSNMTETGLEPMGVRIRHSFVRVDQRSYVAQEYTEGDFAKFGYFWTTEYGLDQDNVATDGTLKHYVGVHDTSKPITVYLGPDYPERYVEVTKQVIDAWNTALKKATGKDDVLRLERNSGQKLGDPRYNMIAIVGERNNSAPAGYGPSVADPKTGELVSSRTFLYQDSIAYIKRSAGDYYDLIKEGKLPVDFETEAREDLIAIGTPSSALASLSKNFPKTMSQWKSTAASVRGPVADMTKLLAKLDNAPASLAPAINTPAMKEMRSAIEFEQVARRYHSIQGRLAARGQCMLGANEHIVSAIQYINANINMSREQLIADLEMKSVFNILLHEVGHNLGLRHNFKGSFDELNFHAKYFPLRQAEAQGQQIDGEYAANYRTSSVMDYNDMFEGLAMAPGPYDYAAIKYAYGKKIELMKLDAQGSPVRDASGAIVTEDVLKGTTKAGSVERPYKFCTDGHVSEDPTCQRFDRGITVNEIVKSLASQYDVSYYLKGFRRGQREFKGSSASVFTGLMLPMRQVLDELFYKLIQGDFEGQEQDGPIAPGNFADYVAALNESMSFFMKVIGTVEPGDYHFDEAKEAFVAGKATEGQISLTVPLGIGKYLESSYVPGGDFEGDERILRRGTEFDKLAAMYVLTMRGFPARKYERISLAANFLAVAKEPVLTRLSSYMRGDMNMDIRAVMDPQSQRLVAVPETYEARGEEQLLDVPVPASVNLASQTNAKIYTMMNYNSSADQTFTDYIDFRIKGVNDQALAGVQDKIEFVGANGLQTYVVPQTLDEMSISYAIAKPGAEASKKMLEAVSEQRGIKADVQAALDQGYEPVLLSVAKVFRAAQGSDLPQATIERFRQNKMIENLQTLLNFINSIEADATSEGNAQLLALIKAERATWPSVVIGIEEKLAKSTQLESVIDDAKSTLRQIESDLIYLKVIYELFN